MRVHARDFVLIAVLILAAALAPRANGEEIPDLIIRNVHIVGTGSQTENTLVNIQIVGNKIKIVSKDSIPARDNIQVLGKTKTVLISTHILQEVDAVADRVIFIHNGRLIFDGAPSELKEDGSLEQPFYRLTKDVAPTPPPETTTSTPDDVSGHEPQEGEANDS